MTRFRGLRRPALLGAAFAVALVGCGQAPPLSDRQHVELLMQKNRQAEDRLLAAEHRLAALAAQVPADESAPPPPPAPHDPFRAIALRFSKFTTVLHAGEGLANERLKVVLEPLDAEGDVVKRAGSLVLEAFEELGDPPRLYHRWTFNADEVPEMWLSGPGLYAYVLKLPWPGLPPRRNRLRLRAAFTTLAGDVLQAEALVVFDRPAGEPLLQ